MYYFSFILQVDIPKKNVTSLFFSKCPECILTHQLSIYHISVAKASTALLNYVAGIDQPATTSPPYCWSHILLWVYK